MHPPSHMRVDRISVGSTHVRERMHASEMVHLHVRERMHASETPYIFSLSRPTENDILIVKLKVTQIDGGLGTKS